MMTVMLWRFAALAMGPVVDWDFIITLKRFGVPNEL